MRYALKNTAGETIRHQDFDEGSQPILAPEKGLVWVADPVPAEPAPVDKTLAEVKAELALTIDDTVASIYGRFDRFSGEYLEREAQAKAFKDGGYIGEAGIWVRQFAIPAGKTDREAADLIIAQAAQLRGAREQLAALRMRKYEIMAASTKKIAQQKSDDIMTGIGAVVAALG